MSVGTMSQVSPARGLVIARWTLQILLALAFTAAAVAKLAGAPMLVETFEQIGIGQWFRYVTALVELSGVVALLLPGFALVGAVWLGITMFFASLTHVFILHNNPAPAVVLLVLCAIVAWLRRDQAAILRAHFG
jgi:uncharacterized membrane protein YphA (DoxX/SURF4 family)